MNIDLKSLGIVVSLLPVFFEKLGMSTAFPFGILTVLETAVLQVYLA